MALLEVDGIRAGYGRLEILKGVSLRVETGQVVSIIGPNGAGKSTVFRALFGLLSVRQGRVRFAGEDVTNRPPADLLHRGMTYVPQGRNVFPLMTVDQNLRLGAYIRPRSAELDRDIERVYELFPMLRAARQRRAAELSGGQQQMLEMGRALLLRPRLMLLDEPTLGLAPVLVKRIFDTVRTINTDGVTIMLVEQNVRRALTLATRACVLESGKLVLQGAGRELLGDDRLKRAYLGL